MIPKEFGSARVVRVEEDGSRVVNVDLPTPDIGAEGLREKVIRTRARARAMFEAGFAEEGFLRDGSLAANVPRLRRRTEVVSQMKVSGNEWNFVIRVRPGLVIE